MSHAYARQSHTPPPLPPPPPPQRPPSTSSSGQHPAAAHSTPRRHLAQTLGISTALTAAQRFGSHLQAQTPASPRVAAAVSPSSPLVSSASPASSSSSPMASSRGASSSTATYNPQEWARTGAAAGQYVPHSNMQARRVVNVGTRDASGMEASMPSPPPPYSASPMSTHPALRAQHGSPLAPSFSSQTSSPVMHTSEFNSPITPATSTSTGGIPSMQRSSSGDRLYQSAAQHSQYQQPSPTSYPPPPHHAQPRDRSSSRSRFGLSAITNRHRNNSGASPSHVELLPQQPVASLARPQQHPSQAPAFTVLPNVAPAARRAASTGCIGTHNSGPTRHPADLSNTAHSGDPNQRHGFALPPPPPGPPPNVRSQSMSRVGEGNGIAPLAAPVAIRGTLRSNQLGPVPPTPADWVDEDVNRQRTPQGPGATTMAQPPSEPAQDISNAPASNREMSSSRGIRERRSETRASRAQFAQPVTIESQSVVDSPESQPSPPHEANDLKPANLVLASATGALSRRRHVNKARTSPLLDGRTSPGMQRRRLGSDEAQQSLPGSASLPSEGLPRGSAPATPYSAGHGQSPSIASPEASSKLPQSTGEDRRNETRVASSPKVSLAGVSSDRVSFGEASLERHRRFVELEAKAGSDQERLELFAEFIVLESRLRRDRYAAAFEALGSDVLELTRDMWRPVEGGRRSKAPTPGSALSGRFTPDLQTSNESELPPEPSSAGSVSNSGHSSALTPATEPESPSDLAAGHARIRSESRNAFQPMLSPIPSMAMSTAADEESVRGRSASRWWEASSDGLSSGTGGRVQRTKRESKYMGLPREARENLQWIPEDSPGFAGPSSMYANLGANEYPAEKTEWHETVQIAEPDFVRHTPATPNIPRLDVSRLITLPPPYPRHHPAVNNSHPDLTSLRAVLRGLSLADEVQTIRTRYNEDAVTASFQPESPAQWAERRKKMRQAIQHEVSVGSMSFADAAQREADFESNEGKRGRERAQQSFQHFQSQVVTPLNTLYNSKINQASAAVEQLVEGLSNEASSHNPNATQEEGDEQPELLEKLTLVKWLHEGREQLYKDMTELEDESNEHYKTIILFPYRQARNQEKVQEVESFFANDMEGRREDFEKKSLRRFEELLRVMEKHVMRGVETQLSAFWDIAPELLTVIQKVPVNLHECEIHIPAQEYEENPFYQDFPLQYLYTLLLHAERSTHQFIESQINLQCLLHEAKTSVMLAGCRLMQTQRWLAGEDARSVDQEMQEIKRSEDSTLTADLKDRVHVVEEQWRQALGTGLEECQQRIKQHLLDQGGFDDSLEE